MLYLSQQVQLHQAEDTNPKKTRIGEKRKKQTILTTAITALFLVVVGVNSGFAKKIAHEGKNSGTHSSQTSGGMDGHTFDSGYNFGKHISDEHATKGKLGKEHNPGQHHQGFSQSAPGIPVMLLVNPVIKAS